MTRRLALLAPLVAGAGLLVAGCGGAPSTNDFADEAVKFIEGEMADNPQLNGLTFSDTTCQQPTSTNTGTEYTCSATGSDGQVRTLTVKIASRNSLQVVALEPGPPAGGDDTTATTSPSGG